MRSGAQRQLGPTLQSQEAKRQGFDRSLLARLMDGCTNKAALLLDVQYRMHPRISAWPSARYYAGRLKDASVTLARAAPVPAQESLGPLVLLHVDGGGGRGGEERARGGSYYNRHEARLVAVLVARLAALGLSVGDSAQLRVLTFYSAQVQVRGGFRVCGAPPPRWPLGLSSPLRCAGDQAGAGGRRRRRRGAGAHGRRLAGRGGRRCHRLVRPLKRRRLVAAWQDRVRGGCSAAERGAHPCKGAHNQTRCLICLMALGDIKC
eukprot:SAG11_NODE_668_length_7841_cov_10.134461_4_plen_263_part_00